MKTKTKLLGSLLLVATMIITPGTVRSHDLSIPFDDSAYQLIEQIQDLESMERGIERCYEAEKRTGMLANLSRQPSTDSMQLNGELINRVFSHLAGAPEHERFVNVYHALIQSPDYRQLYSADLFAEYMRLIESARTRLTTQLKERLKRLANESSAQCYDKNGFAESDPVNIVIRQYSGGAKTTQSDAVSPTITEKARPILIDGGKGTDLRNYRR
jgi:hypothetical protein